MVGIGYKLACIYVNAYKLFYIIVLYTLKMGFLVLYIIPTNFDFLNIYSGAFVVLGKEICQ